MKEKYENKKSIKLKAQNEQIEKIMCMMLKTVRTVSNFGSCKWFRGRLEWLCHVVTCKNFSYKFMKQLPQGTPESGLGTTNFLFSFDISSSFYLRIKQTL